MNLVTGTPFGKPFAVALCVNWTAESRPVTHITFLQSFFDELRRRVAAGGQ
jgi:hypothetical protein